jgi:hypothetical protein
VRDGPLLLRFTPQRKGDGAPAEHLILPFSSEDVLELDVTEKDLRFDDEIVDRLTTLTTSVGRASSVARPVIVRPAKRRGASTSIISTAQRLADVSMPSIVLTSRRGAGVPASRNSMPPGRIRH